MNAELVKLAMEKVGNAYVLVNLVSRRVRQLNAGGGASRPLVANTESLGPADIALREIVEGNMGWEMPEWVPVTRPVGKRRKKPESERPRVHAPAVQIKELVAV
jgi:DNA-directed RNA polymerase subunit omega